MVIGIAGGSGSGKTTFARKMLGIIGEDKAIILEQDSYYKDQSAAFKKDPSSVSFDHPDVIDFDLMTLHLAQLKAGNEIECPRYDFVTHSRFSETTIIKPKPVIIVEGILIFCAANLFKELELTFFMDATEDLRLQRRIKRDVVERGRNEKDVREQFYKSVKPMHDQFVEPSKRRSLYVIKT